jgi:hypothetical protein
MKTRAKRYVKPTIGNAREIEARKKLLSLYKATPIPDEDRLVNIGLYMRSVILAKMLYLDELYRAVLDLPGIIVEFGVWWGANVSLFGALRNVHEPYNWRRKVVGFDTFAGYQGITGKDGDSEYVAPGGFAVSTGYEAYLRDVLDAQEADNVNAQVKKYELVRGDVTKTIGQYLTDHPETLISLAYFDLGLYEPTKKCLEAIRPHLVRGSVLAMDELNCPEFPGETLALREVLGLDRYRILRSRFLPDRAYVIVD